MKAFCWAVLISVISVTAAAGFGQSAGNPPEELKERLAKALKDSGRWSDRSLRSKVTDVSFRNCTLIVEREDITKLNWFREPGFTDEAQVSAALDPRMFRVEEIVTEIDLSRAASPLKVITGITKKASSVRISSLPGDDFATVRRKTQYRPDAVQNRDVTALTVKESEAETIRSLLQTAIEACKIGSK